MNILLLIFLASPLELSLDQCLQRVREHHPLIAASEADVSVADAQARAVGGKRFPTISGLALTGPVPAAHGDAVHTTTSIRDYGGMVGSLGPFLRAEVSVVQPIFTFGKLDQGLNAMREVSEVKRASADITRREALTQAKELYYGWVFVDDLLALVGEVEQILSESKGYLEKHLESDEGDVKPIDRQKLLTYETEITIQHREIERRKNTLVDGLSRIMGMESDWQPVDRELVQIELPKTDAKVLASEACERHPSCAEAEHGLRALHAKRALWRAKRYPDIFVAGRVGYAVAPNRDVQRSPFAVEDFNFLMAAVVLGVSYNWDIGVLGPETEAVDAELVSLSAKREGLRQKVEHDVLAASWDVEAAQEKVIAAKDGYRAARAWVSFAKNGFELGSVSAKDLIDALGAFLKARFTLLDLTYAYNVGVARLSLAAGVELQPELKNEGW